MMQSRQLRFGRRAMLAMTAAGVGFARGARAEDRLVLYSANDDTVNKIVADGFKAASGITVDVVSTGSGVLFRRLNSEAARPQADVVWGVSTALLTQNRKLFAPYAAKEREQVPASYRDPDNLWLGTNLQVVTINRNTNSIPAGQGPTRWEDLLDPKWKGKIAYTDPANSGFSYAAATMLISHWGDNDAARAKLGKLLANCKVLNRSTLVFDGNGTGEYPLGISLEYAGYLWAHNGAPVAVAYPADGTVALAEGAAIIKGGPNPQAAQKFVDYLNSTSLQDELLRTTFRRPARQGVNLTAAGMPPLSKLKLLSYDDQKWDAARRETLEQLKALIQETR